MIISIIALIFAKKNIVEAGDTEISGVKFKVFETRKARSY